MVAPLAVTMGEPSGIGGEIVIEAWLQRERQELPPFFLIDNPERIKALAKQLGKEMPISVIDSPENALACFNGALPIISIDLKEPVELGQLNSVNGHAVVESIEKAVEFSMEGRASGVVTNPIHKGALYDIGFNYPGHTEFVAHLCGKGETPVMMLATDELRVVPLTVHIALKDVSSSVTAELIEAKVKIIQQALIRDFGIEQPHIAIAGLNPHAGEGGKMGMEEIEVITPTIEKLQNAGLNVSGPHPADTLFHEDARGNYDVALGMYHDQALIPLKTLDFHGGVNVTLGLSVVRTSPDHGTALDIAGKGIARPDSLIEAIKLAGQIAKNRAE